MLNAPQSVRDALRSGRFRFADLLTLNLGDAYDQGSDQVRRYTNAGHEVTAGSHTFTHDNALVEIEGLSRKASTGQDKVDLVFSLTDETLVEAICTQRYVGKESKIERVLLDEAGQVIGGYILPVRTARGVSHEIEGDEEKPTITLTIDSVLGDLDGGNTWYCNDASHQARYPGDRFMRHAADAQSGEGSKPRYIATESGLVQEVDTPPTVPVRYGLHMATPTLVAKLKHRKSHSSYRHYYTTWVFILSAGEIDGIDLASLRHDDKPRSCRDVRTDPGGGGWKALLRKPGDSSLSFRDDPLFGSFRTQMDERELTWLDNMHGHGLSVLIIGNRNRDDWVASNNFTLPVRGLRCFDPRTGQTAFTRNPALQYFDYLRSQDYGLGNRDLGVSTANMAQLADHFDALPGNDGNGIDSIQFDVEIDTGDPYVDCMDAWIEGCKLYTADYFGQMSIRVETISQPVLTLTADDCEGEPSLDSGDFTERPSRWTYDTKQLIPDPDPDNDGQIEVNVEATFPPEGSAIEAQWLAEDGGRVNHESKQLKFSRDLNQALYWAKYDCINARLNAELTLVPPPIAWLLEPGDVIAYVDPLLEQNGSLWRVLNVTEQEGETELVLRPYSAAALVPDLAVVPAPLPPAQPPKDRYLTLPTNLRLTQSEAGHWLLSWLPGQGQARYYTVQVTRDGATVLETTTSDTWVRLDALVAGSYLAVVQPHNSQEEGPEAALAFELKVPTTPSLTDLKIEPGNTYVIITPSLVGMGYATEYEFAFRGEFPDGERVIQLRTRGGFQRDGLAPEKTYYFSIRRTELLGVSEWLEVSATTTNNPKVVNAVLDVDPDTSVGDTLRQMDRDIGQGMLDSLQQAMGDYDITKQAVEQEQAQATLAKGQQLQAEAQASIAAQIEVLQAQTAQATALIAELKRASVYERSVTAELGTSLRVEMDQAVAEANHYTQASIGYWIDSDGQIVAPDSPNAETFVAGPFAEELTKLAIRTGDGQTASIAELMQVFQTVDGQLVARGGLTSNVNGQINGWTSFNDGQKRALDFLTGLFRVGDLNAQGAFVPLFYFNTVTGRLRLHGDLVLGDGTTVTDESSIRGRDGTPGAGTYELTLRGGVWPGSATATNDFEDYVGRAPVKDDVLVYWSSDRKVFCRYRWSGSAWVKTTAFVHGDMIVTDTFEASRVKVGTELVSSRIKGAEYIDNDGVTLEVRNPTPFGPDNLVYWSGRSAGNVDGNGDPIYANLTKTAAAAAKGEWRDASGDRFFGGTLSAGVRHNAIETTVKTLYGIGSYPVHLGPFSTNGAAKVVVVSFAYSAGSSRTSNPGSINTKHLTYKLQRRTTSSGWVTLKTETVQWQVGVAWDSEFNHYWIDEMAHHSITYTDNNPSTEDFEYRIEVTSHDRFHTSTHVSTQKLSIISTEQ